MNFADQNELAVKHVDADLLSFILRECDVGFWEYCPENNQLQWDPVKSGSYGQDRSSFPTSLEEFLQFVDPNFREGLATAFRQCIETGHPYRYEFKANLPNRGVRWRLAIGSRIADGAGKAVKVVGLGIDITDRKSLEERVERTQELETLARMAGNVAHDLINLLSGIQTYCYVLLNSAQLQHDAIDVVEKMQTAAMRAHWLAQELRDSRSAQSEPLGPSDMNGLVKDTLKLISVFIPCSIELVEDIEDHPILVWADAGQIERVLMNLCLNAIDAMPGGGTLTVRTSSQDARPLLSVSDTGCGIPEDIRSNIFEPYFTTKPNGTGLGLCVVNQVVQKLSGTIEIHSRQNLGTSFEVRLPCAGGRSR